MPTTTPHIDPSTAAQLQSIVERVEAVHEEKKQLESDIADIYAEAKSNGFDTKVLKAIVAERRKDPAAVREFEAIFATYMHALARAEFAPDTTASVRGLKTEDEPRHATA